MLAVLIEKVHRRARRDEEQRAEFAHALGLVVDALERVFPVVRDVAVEFVEFLVRYLLLRARPERLHRVDGLFLFVLFIVLRILDVNRVGYEVGVFLDDAAYRPLGEVVLELFAVVVLSGGLHVQSYRRAVRLARAAVYRICAVAGRFPLPAFGGAGLARLYGDFVCGDEARIKADAELPDEVAGRAVLCLAERLYELARAAARYRAEVGDEVVAAHADAVVGEGQRPGLFVYRYVYAAVFRVFRERLVAEALNAQLVYRVGGVGDELAHEYIRVRIYGVDHQLQNLFSFALKFHFLSHLYLPFQIFQSSIINNNSIFSQRPRRARAVKSRTALLPPSGLYLLRPVPPYSVSFAAFSKVMSSLPSLSTTCIVPPSRTSPPIIARAMRVSRAFCT